MKSILIILILGISISSFWHITKNKNLKVALPSEPKVQPTPMNSLVSPDGKESLSIKKTPSDGNTTYSVSATSGLVFTKTLPESSNISIPFNSWSPDYKYLFLKEELSGQNNYYIFSSSGKGFANSSQYLNITEQFVKKLPDYKLKDVTGWAAPTLLVVNTEDSKGKQGPSFWFDIQSQSFIQLSTRFN